MTKKPGWKTDGAAIRVAIKKPQLSVPGEEGSNEVQEEGEGKRVMTG